MTRTNSLLSIRAEKKTLICFTTPTLYIPFLHRIHMEPTNITLNLFTHIKPFQSIYLTPKRHKIKYLPNDSDRITTSSSVVPGNRKHQMEN